MGAQSSKEQFASVLNKLVTTDVEPTDHDFWDDLWKTSLTVEEIFEVISPYSINKLIAEKPRNMRILFTQAVAQLYQVVETPYPVYFDQALNCVRILSRMCPQLLEKSSMKDNKADSVTFAKDLLWSRQRGDKPANASEGETQATEDAKKDEPESEEHQEPEPLAVILVNTLFHLLFLPDFTIDDPIIDFSENDVNTPEFKTALMWAPGVGSIEKSVVNSTAFDQNRVEVLRLMVSSFSDSLYQSPDEFDCCSSIWLEIATSAEIPYGEIVFYSLINTVLGYDPVGWGLPYGNLVATDTAKQLMETAIQVLIILLDYGYPIKLTDSQSNQAGPQSVTYISPDDTDAQGFNVFRRLLSCIESPDQLNFIYRGFARLLNNVHQSETTYLPYSITKIKVEQELLVLFWKCIEEIPKFMPYVLRQCDINELVGPICYFMIDGRKDPGKIGLVYLCTFILLKLSGERNFGVNLNKPYLVQLPIDIPLFTGSYADLVIIVLHKIIVSGIDKLSALYNCFLTIICNISPYCKSLCSVTAVKLVNLLQLFTSPKFLYATEGNHIYVTMILETLNNIIQYQYEGNVNVIYSIVRRKEIFESLANLTLPAAIKGAVDVAEKRSKARAEQLSKLKSPKSSNSVNSFNSSVESSSGSTVSTATSSSVAGSESKESSGEVAASVIKKSNQEEENIDHVEATPTDLISISHVERTVNESGEIEDKHTSLSAPETESDKISTEVPSSSPIPPLGTNEATSSNLDSKGGAKTTEKPTSARLKFTPTQTWLNAVKSELPMNTIMRLLKNLVPQIEAMAQKHSGQVDEVQVLEFIHNTTMVGLLPVPHPIVIRKYQPNKYTSLWFTVFQWGVIFMHNQEIQLFDSKSIKLFLVQTITV